MNNTLHEFDGNGWDLLWYLFNFQSSNNGKSLLLFLNDEGEYFGMYKFVQYSHAENRIIVTKRTIYSYEKHIQNSQDIIDGVTVTTEYSNICNSPVMLDSYLLSYIYTKMISFGVIKDIYTSGPYWYNTFDLERYTKEIIQGNLYTDMFSL